MCSKKGGADIVINTEQSEDESYKQLLDAVTNWLRGK